MSATTRRLDLVKKTSLRRTIGNHDECVIFTARGADVRVYAYATHSDHVNDQTVSREEAREVWRQLVAKGYRRVLPVDIVMPSA